MSRKQVSSITNKLAGGRKVKQAKRARRRVMFESLEDRRFLAGDMLQLTILADSISENAGPAATTATVTRTMADQTSPLVVNLTSSDPTELTVPAQVTIPANLSSITFDISAVNDAIVDGTQSVTVTASAAGSTGSATVDTSFGNNGLVVSSLRYNVDPQLYDMELQSDGKIVAIGRHPTSDTTWRVIRLMPNGSYDSSFGVGGIVDTQFFTGPGPISGIVPNSVEIFPDGSIAVAGTTSQSTSSVLIARYRANGTPDTAFNGTGTLINSAAVYPSDIAASSDGSLWMTGPSGGTTTGFSLWKISPTGVITSNQTLNVGAAANDERASQILIQPDGKIVVGGTVSSSGLHQVFSARFLSNGSLDTSFNGGISALVNPGGSPRLYDMKLAADGKIVVVGGTFSPDLGYVVRWNADGTVDTGFSGDGLSLVQASTQDRVTDVELLSNGKMVLLGSTFVSGVGFERTIFRMNADGSLDTTFDGDGIQRLPTLPSVFERIVSGVVQPDGKLITFSEYTSNYRIERFNISQMTAADTVNVTDDEPLPNISVSIAGTAPGNETSPATTSLTGTFTVSQSEPAAVATILTYSVSGTAVSGSDFTPLSGTVTIPAGATSATVRVAVTNDNIVEATESLTLTLTGITSNSPGVSISATNNAATIDILDNDSATLSIASTAGSNYFASASGTYNPNSFSAQTLMDNNWTMHRFQVVGSPVSIGSVGGLFHSHRTTNTTLFAAITALTSSSDYPDAGNLTSADLVTTTTFTLPANHSLLDITAPVSATLSPGWYALTFGTGAFGASSIGTNFGSGISMPQIPTDLAPTQLPVGIINGQFIDQVTTTRYFVNTVGDARELGPTNGQFSVTQSAISSTDTVVSYTVGGTATSSLD